MFQKKVVEKMKKKYFVKNNICSPKIVPFVRWCGKTWCS